MKKSVRLVLIGVAVLLVVALSLTVANKPQSKPTTNSNDARPADYDALVDRAIKENNPKLCDKVEATTMPGPTDGPVAIYGQEARDFCKKQVKQGGRIYGV